MSLFNLPNGTFSEGIEASSIILTDESSQIKFGSDESTILNVSTQQNKIINISDVGKDIDLVYVDTGTTNITDFTVQTSVNFSGSLVGDVSGTQGATTVDSVGGKVASNISDIVDDVENATYGLPTSQICKTDPEGNIDLWGLTVWSTIIGTCGNTLNVGTRTAVQHQRFVFCRIHNSGVVWKRYNINFIYGIIGGRCIRSTRSNSC